MKDPAWAEKYRKANRSYWLANREKVQFNTARYQAKRRGLEFTIKFEDVVWPDVCPALGVRLERKPKGPCDWSPSLDRIDNSKGYVPGNVIVVSMRANRIKTNAAVSELYRVADFYKNLSGVV